MDGGGGMTDANTFTTDFARMRREIGTVKSLIDATITHLTEENTRLCKENADLRRKLEESKRHGRT
jgi:hypothetical protein